jgi:hypothetical protein
MAERLAKLFGLLAGYLAVQVAIRAIDLIEWPEPEPAAAA